MLKNVLPLGFIAASRFFGLFLIMPVLSVGALALEGVTPQNVGLIVGVYAISQMIFQVPFGFLSDKTNRKFAIAIGLLVFVVGCFVCANATNFTTMLVGRILQGSGAVGGVASALVADFVKDGERSKAMALMGMMIGVSFCAALALSPFLNAHFGLNSLFYLPAAISLASVVLLFCVVEREPKRTAKSEKVKFDTSLLEANLLRLNLTSFLQKMFLSAVFVVLPLQFGNTLGISYALGAFLGFVAMGAAGALGDKKRLNAKFVSVGIVLFGVSFTLISWGHEKVGVVLFFVAFCLHEPSMQTLAASFAPPRLRGSALSIFTACGYAGSFVGGVVGSLAFVSLGLEWFLLALNLVGLAWLLAVFHLKDRSEV